VTAAVGKQGVDVLYDPIGGAAFMQGLRCLKWGGHALVIGFASGQIPKLPLNLALVKNITVHGIYWGSYAQHAGPYTRSLLSSP
jgi:NADPH2:quinone reductase